MTKKEHLKKLIQKYSHINEVAKMKDKILGSINNYSSKTLETFILVFEKYENREIRIKAGEAKAVIKEIQTEKVEDYQKERKKAKKDLQKKTAKSKSEEAEKLQDILEELN